MVNVIVETTPNPATMKFLPGCPVTDGGTANYPSPDSAGASPLARELFEITGVAGVFFGADFVSVAKRETADWSSLEPVVANTVAAFFDAGGPALIVSGGDDPAAGNDRDEDDETVSRIKELLDTRVRPSVAMDGGDIVYRGFERGVVYLSLQGACVGCPSSNATLKMGVENLLTHYVPEVLRVQAVD